MRNLNYDFIVNLLSTVDLSHLLRAYVQVIAVEDLRCYCGI